MSECLFSCKIKVPRHSSKKNEKQPAFKNGQVFIRKKKAALHVENIMLALLVREKLKNRIFEPIENDIQVAFKFYFPKSVYYTVEGVRSQKLPDLSNLYQLPEDVLQKAKIIKNDTQIESHSGSGRFPIDGAEYWLEIQIFKFN